VKLKLLSLPSVENRRVPLLVTELEMIEESFLLSSLSLDKVGFFTLVPFLRRVDCDCRVFFFLEWRFLSILSFLPFLTPSAKIFLFPPFFLQVKRYSDFP